MSKIRHFKTQEGFDKSMAYIHIHHIEHGHEKFVDIGGKKYKPSHKKGSW